MIETFTIGELEAATGVPRRTIYFYVQQGILPPPTGAGLAARYHDAHVARLRAIPRLKGMGWRLDQIRDFFQRSSESDIAAVLEENPPVREIHAWSAKPAPSRASAPLASLEPTALVGYRLAPGVDLIMRRDLPAPIAEAVARLLDAASTIFGRSADDGSQHPTSDDTPTPYDPDRSGNS